ncbi:MAG: DMT family transporter [Candidatus Heimdallarchaeota archaeon]
MLSRNEKSYQATAYVLLLITTIVWAGTWPLGRWLVSESIGGETIPPMMIALVRYLIVAPVILILLRLKEGTLNVGFVKLHWKFFCFLGIISVTIYQAGYLIGEFYTSASDAVIIISSQPLIVLILASAVFKIEELNLKKLFGTLLSFSGILLVFIFSPNTSVLNRVLGNILIFVAAISYSVYLVASRRFINENTGLSKTFSPSSLYIVSWVSFFGMITLLPVSLTVHPEYLANPVLFLQIPSRVWFGILYLALLSSIIGYWFYLEGIKRLSASRAVIFQNLVPIFGVILSVILLGEVFDVLIHGSSITLIISGITLVNREK